MNSEPGTYAVVLRCSRDCGVEVGKLGEVRLRKGHYIYIGSAFGPGGVQARVMRHHRSGEVRHWHIDYLRPHMSMVEAWYTHDAERREHLWVTAMNGMDILPYAKGFGSSDCDCYSHLFHTVARPEVSRFRDAIARDVVTHDPIDVWIPT